jgi:malate dehydrogenase (oxaloacetate-decarboxylating)(NADP+)
MFLGLSIGDILQPEALKKMAKDPIVFALANPDPEIAYDLAMAARDDIIMATGRSDHPNQVNNVLGFPYIFRGALDVRATTINEAMKLAAVKAIADLAKEPVPEMVLKAYTQSNIRFGQEYLIPKPLDPRLITRISPAVAKAAIETGVARTKIEDWNKYEEELQERIGIDNRLISRIVTRARKNPKHVVFAEADDVNILKAAQMSKDEGIAIPILLGDRDKIHELIRTNELDGLLGCKIINPYEETEKVAEYAQHFYDLRKRKGMTLKSATTTMTRSRNHFGSMMVRLGEGDALISGLSNDYPRTILPALQIIGVEEGINRVAGMYIISNRKKNFFFADTTVNLNPTAEELVDIIGLTARVVKFFDTEPRIAMLSYSNFGSNRGEVPEKAAKAVELTKQKWPDLVIDGDIQANVALNHEILKKNYPFSDLAKKPANTLIFPDLGSGNIAYKLLMEIGGAEAIGPILMGMKKSVHVLQVGSSVRDIFNMVAISVVDAQLNEAIEKQN